MRTRVGSSPLARGLPVPSVKRVNDNRIIPARAGFTAVCLPGHPRDEDHPRSRGVYIDEPGSQADLQGSSPLARGLQLWRHEHDYSLRIIPARAGFTALLGMAVVR